MAAVILWALTVTVVLLLHGTSPHGTHSGGALVSLRADRPALGLCQVARSAHHLRSDPGDGGRPVPWGHCDATLHHLTAPASGHGDQTPRGCSGPSAEANPAARSAAPHRIARPTRLVADVAPARLQVFRC
ncbi:hypothetical protein [Actinoallomurus sp. NPDC050550]|uniref:hypothetical protein n=1 Tax=Actinoallomurus sp. NPDC050550 TaxID=3154937 RepID=UPI003402F4E8